ncbi:MAG: glycoside hydrolase family 30 beta sandwich domain-containing protein [Phycisphaerales bacterium]
MHLMSQCAFRHPREFPRLIAIILAIQGVVIRLGQAEMQVDWWVSSMDMGQKLCSQPPASWTAGPSNAQTIIHVDSTQTFQSILGLGSSLEHSTCYNISRLPSNQQEEVMESLVGADKGIGMSLMRICIGTPDFTASPWYSYDDMPRGEADPELKHFSIDRDKEYVLPILKLALQKNPDLVFFASVWGPPAWMKTNGKLGGGKIDPKHFPSLAQYFVRFIEAYEAEENKIYAVTVQNEPGCSPSSYPTCGWTAEQQRDFIGNHLGPAFQAKNIVTKIWCYDHNFSNLRFPTAILADPGASRDVDGTAFHHYEGKPSAMTTLSKKFPDKHVYFTEGSVFGVQGAAQIIQFLRNGARSYNAWVTIIDHKGKPNPGPHDCSPTCIVLDSDSLALDYRFDYYMYGQFMKFIRPGAVRVQSDEPSALLANCAVHHSDGSIVLVVVNRGAQPARFDIEWDGRHLSTAIGGSSVGTYRWASWLGPQRAQSLEVGIRPGGVEAE